MELLLNDLEIANNKKYGFNNDGYISKTFTSDTEVLILRIACKMSYFTPKGKARLKPIYSYLIYSHDTYTKRTTFINIHSNKTTATKEFNKFKRRLPAIKNKAKVYSI